ncbi:hypothetical protein [Vibrio cholerae]|uniref:hypothetical protein n=1 Tax=Vibrio cholerae TaxID=666 RepID=UPI0029346289|nr:hypothetical protein [Vibrio cholerae]MDV2344665.1 hypothetical protein [Vibrio cholerae]
MDSFFKKETHLIAIKSYINFIERVSIEKEYEQIINKFVLDILNDIYNHPDYWDKLCQISVNMIGARFIEKINLNNPNKYDIENVFSLCYQFATEFNLSNINDFNDTVPEILECLESNIGDFDAPIQHRIRHIKTTMPILLLKNILYSNDIISIQSFNEASKKIAGLKKDWDEELEKKHQEVLDLKKSLEKFKEGFNFVGLYEGFDKLHEEKVNEKDNILFWMRILSLLIVCPISLELAYIYSSIPDFERIKMLVILSFLPTFSLIGICIYYFRILLVNYKSVKSQILQLDLRKTLCRFIQHYVSYAKEFRDIDSQLLNKFENIIFSGIVADNEKLPSTFDGIEQLSTFIKSIK